MNFTAVRPARRNVAVVALTAVFVSLFFLAAQNPGDARSKPVRAAVAITTKDQKSLLRARGLVVRVRAAGRTTVRLTAGANFRGARVSFRRRGSRVVKLRLTARGSRTLGTCGTRAVSVRWSSRAVGAPVSAGVRSKRLRADRSRCVRVPLGADPQHCDFLDTSECLYPFANDYFTRRDNSTETGKRLDIAADATPANFDPPNKPIHIDPSDMNRGDGFSPGNMIVLKIPGLDTPAAFQNSGLVPITDTGAYDDPDQSVIVIDAQTGERHPIWAELDSNPTTVDPVEDGPAGGINTNPGNTDEVNLIVRAAKNYEYGHRYIVAFRNLKDAENQPIGAPIGFRVYRDRLGTLQPVVEKRRAHMNSVISTVVNKAGVNRRSLYMAWDFTVASEKSITGRALQIRDDAFSRLGDINLADRTISGDSPDFSIVNVCDKYVAGGGPSCGGGIGQPGPASDTQRVILGRLTGVPCYLDQNGCMPGATFDFKANGEIDFNPAFSMNVPFKCFIPETVQPGGEGNPVDPGRAGIYGHGLLGDLGQTTSAGPVNVGRDAGSVWCGANWDGFSAVDLGSVVASLEDMSNFNKAVDRMQQGFVNFMMLGRAMIHEDGLPSDPAFRMDEEAGAGQDLKSAIDLSQGSSTRLQYMGISQGGIMGGALMALTPDADYGVLGVPGMNYSALLRRSVDSDTYFKNPNIGLYRFYPNYRERPLVLALMQLLWDRGEANGYAEAMTSNPLPNTPPHNVLLRVAFGDHQVANVTAETELRTIGGSMYSPALNPGRHWESSPFSGMNLASSFPFSGGSMMVYYDSGPPSWTGPNGQGIATPPNGNVPPRSEWGFGGDPHEHPRRSPDGVRHAVTFLDNGTIESCETTTASPGDAHCYANGWTGPNP